MAPGTGLADVSLRGVAKDTLPEVVSTHPSTFVCNTHDSDQPGDHWENILFYFTKPIKLTSAAGVTLMGQYKHTNINLTTEMGSD